MKDYYAILRVHPSVSEEEIKEAYRRLAHKYHPDMEGGDAVKFKEMHEAYEVLSNPYKRGVYDTKRETPEIKVVYRDNPQPQQTTSKKKEGMTAGWIFFLIIMIGIAVFIASNM